MGIKWCFYNFMLCTSCALFWIMGLYLQSLMPWPPLEWIIVMLSKSGCSWRTPRNFNCYRTLLHRQLLCLYDDIQYVIPLFCKLHWLPICFWQQLKMQDLIFKALHGMDPGYLRDHPFHITSTHPIWLSRIGCCRSHLLLMGTDDRSSPGTPSPPPEVRLAFH